MMGRRVVLCILGILTITSFVFMVKSALLCSWEAATTFATLFVGIVAADVVMWQGHLIKLQLAFSTYLDLDKEWNSEDMIEARQTVHAPDSESWNDSRLEAILEFFEKLALLFKVSGDMPLVYRSTLGWYAAQYFLFAREHGQIKHLRQLWQDEVYQDIEDFYAFYLTKEAGRSQSSRRAWESKRLCTEDKFWKQERKD
jgi:hypothetical protein